jgi:hypothetical protein
MKKSKYLTIIIIATILLQSFVYTSIITAKAEAGGVDHLVINPKTATIIAGQSQTYAAAAFNRGGHSHNVATLPGKLGYHSPVNLWTDSSGASQ